MMGQSLRWRLRRKKFTLHPVSLRRFVSLRWFCPPPLLLHPRTGGAHSQVCSALLPLRMIASGNNRWRTNEWLVIMASDVECLHRSLSPPRRPTCLMMMAPTFRRLIMSMARLLTTVQLSSLPLSYTRPSNIQTSKSKT